MRRSIQDDSHSSATPLGAGRAGRTFSPDRLNPIPSTGVTAARADSARADLLNDSASQFTDAGRVVLIGRPCALPFLFFDFRPFHAGSNARD